MWVQVRFNASFGSITILNSDRAPDELLNIRRVPRGAVGIKPSRYYSTAREIHLYILDSCMPDTQASGYLSGR